MASSTAALAPLSLLLALVLAISIALSPALAGPSGAVIDGALDVSITGPALKHWGIPGAIAAFVPDTDRSGYARGIRDATNAGELCAALSRVSGRDPAIASARAEGDGSLEHRSGDEMQIEFRIGVAQLAAAARGAVYVCSNPIVAVIGRGDYPDERFVRVADQRLRWLSPKLTLHPGQEVRVHGTASLDASQW